MREKLWEKAIRIINFLSLKCPSWKIHLWNVHTTITGLNDALKYLICERLPKWSEMSQVVLIMINFIQLATTTITSKKYLNLQMIKRSGLKTNIY